MSTAPVPAGPAGLTATARVAAGPGGTLPVLAGEGPLALRRTRAAGPYAQVTVVGAMSAPLGGDRLRLVAEARPGASLRITSAAAMVALPGRTGGPARFDTELTVGEGGELRWLPEPLISARGSELATHARIELAAGARLVFREEQVLGRAGEESGRLTSRITVRRAGRTVLDQELSLGPGVPGWDGGAVLGGHRAAGQLLVVDPDAWGEGGKPAEPCPPAGTAAVFPLAGAPAVLVTALAPDALALRRLLETALPY
ncbi:urease accessory protein UreD [Streptomyces sp. YIM 98790]|uniref:urease accessory protein UreD n=1 Tax=Streptomyces sp. YIM 98790 TaxID=2689077 RepID=UPI00140E7092|nr:urease accessory protein UreD [Streptomyces sp. YIM 98790]